VRAVLSFANTDETAFDVYNISTRDSLSVNQIANIALEVLNVDVSDVQINYTGGARGWKADVPIVKLDPSKIENTGWRPKFTSQSAMHDSILAMMQEIG
jgi:UDP-glucose 4-epimerase